MPQWGDRAHVPGEENPVPKNPVKKLIPILYCLLCIAPAFAQPTLTFSQDAEALFQRGLARYVQKNYTEARLSFQELIEIHAPNQRTSAARLMLAKSHYKLKDYTLAIATAVELQLQFPYSRYLSESDLLIGDCYFYQGQTYSAAAQYGRVLTSNTDVRTRARAADRLGQMAGVNSLTDRDIDRLKTDFGRATIDEAIAFGQARWPLLLGHPDRGQRHLSAFIERHPTSPFAAMARQILLSASPEVQTAESEDKTTAETLSEPERPRYKIGVIGPVNTPLGEDLRNGILLARDHAPLTSNDPVGLIFEDSEGDPIRAVRVAQRLLEQHDVIAIIGALSSIETTPLAALLSAHKVPLVAPTASDDGIASLSPYIFQMNATPGAQGRRIAEYAVRKRGLRMLATLASRDAYGQRIAREFTTKAEELGAEVLIQEWYESGATDYRRQFDRIRSAGLALRPPRMFASEIDSLLRGGIRLNAPPIAHANPDTGRPEVVETLDGILIVGDDADLLLIAPQFHSALIPAQILGSDGWNHARVARDGGAYVDGAIFVAKYHDQSELPSVQNFVNAYRTRYNKDQNIVAALGYDAMLAVLKAINAGGTDREKLRDRLETLTDVPSATGRIAFSRGDRENAWMNLLAIRRGRIEPLPETP